MRITDEVAVRDCHGRVVTDEFASGDTFPRLAQPAADDDWVRVWVTRGRPFVLPVLAEFAQRSELGGLQFDGLGGLSARDAEVLYEDEPLLLPAVCSARGALF